jgi:hypothetical protein
VKGVPGSRLRARLRPDAPVLRGLMAGIWHDVFGGEAGRLPPGGELLLRPPDVLIDDKGSYVPVARSMVELGSTDGARLLLDAADRRWVAALVPESADGNGAGTSGSHTLRFVCQDGAYLLMPGVAEPTLDPWSDSDLLELLEATRQAESPPTGLRTEARVRPAFAWGYRMLDPDAWYLVDPRWTTERALVLVTVDGGRVVDAGHSDTRSFLD